MEGPMKEKARCPWNLLRLFGIRKKRGVSAEERRVRDGVYSSRRSDRIRRSSASDHVVANCSNLVFHSAFYKQPVQIHEKGGGGTCSRFGALQTRRAAQFITL